MTFVSTQGQALEQVERLRILQNQLADFQNQLATGKKTQTFKGLGTDIIASKRSRADFASLDNFINNIDIADRRMKMMEASTAEVQKQARAVLQAIELQTQQGEIEIESIQDLSGKVFDLVVNLLNEQDGDRYLFGGAETRTKPITDSGTMGTYLSTRINGWLNGTITNQEMIDSYRERDGNNLHDTLMGYSAPLAQGEAKKVFVRVDKNAEIDYTILANNEGLRDILAAVGTISKLTESIDEVTLDPNDDPLTTIVPPGATQQERNNNFFGILNDLASMLADSIDKIDTDRFNLSQNIGQIGELKKSYAIEKKTLADTIGNVEDADMNEVAVKLNALSVQLEASYRIAGFIRDLSLVNFL